MVTGSKQGITNPPGNPAYNASKAAVKALAEHLSFDLKDTKIGVHLLVPGWTFTGLVRLSLTFTQLPHVTNMNSLVISQDPRSRNQTVRGLARRLRSICTR